MCAFHTKNLPSQDEIGSLLTATYQYLLQFIQNLEQESGDSLFKGIVRCVIHTIFIVT